MKKLLVLLTVLAVASVASAGMVFDGKDQAQPGEIVTISVIGDAVCTGMNIGGLRADAGSLAAGELNDGLNQFPSTGTPKDGSWENLWLIGISGTPSLGSEPAAGDVLYTFTLDTTGLEIGTTVTIDDWSGIYQGAGRPYMTNFNTVSDDIAAMSVEIVPEPMTIALMGLGGLFLRRRK